MQRSDADGSSIGSPPTDSAASPLPVSRIQPLRVGYALNPKKTRLFDARGLFTQPSALPTDSTPHPTFTALDLTRSLHEQGPFDVLLLKLTDAMARALYEGDEEARELVERMDAYGRESGCVMIDDLQLVRRVLDRRRISELLTSANITVSGYPVRTPPAISVQLPTAEPIALPFTYPVICKPAQSCGSASSHTFYILYNVEQLCCLAVGGSYLVQKLLPHSGTMYKVYVLNSQSFVIPKPSIPPHVTAPTQPPHGPLTLDSQSMSLTPLIHTPTAAVQMDVDASVSVSTGTRDLLQLVSGRLSAVFGLTLFGFDVVVSGDVLYVVDVNYFPSYNRVDGLSDKLAAAIVDKYGREMAASQQVAIEQQRAVQREDVKTNGHTVRRKG